MTAKTPKAIQPVGMVPPVCASLSSFGGVAPGGVALEVFVGDGLAVGVAVGEGVFVGVAVGLGDLEWT